MKKWILLIALLFLPLTAVGSEQFMCGQDANSNGEYDQSELAFCNVGVGGQYCPIGATQCETESETVETPVIETCPSGWTQNGNQCVTTKPSYYTCPSGGSLSGATCIRTYSLCEYDSKRTWCAAGQALRSVKWRGGFVNVYSCPSNWTYAPGSNAYFKRGKRMASMANFDVYETCKKWSDSYPASKVCPSGYRWNNNRCEAYSTPDRSCPADYSMVNGKCTKTVVNDVCPLGNFSCVSDGSAKYCSANPCVDLEAFPPEETDIDGSMLIDDGERTDDGICKDQVYIYGGRAQRCKTPGFESAWQNCCDADGAVLQDNAGSISSMNNTVTVISEIYAAAEIAYTTYAAQTAAGVSSQFAASLAANAAQQQLMLAFDPTTLAIAVAMYVIMEWVASACDQMEMETAMAAASGYCVELGEFCKKKIKILGCVQKARAYCCFNSKLARIIHEQGRPQLTTFNGFGRPEEPNCRGFTPEEFQQIDFSQIDLTEYVEDIQMQTQDLIQENIQQVTEDFYNNIK